MTLLTLTLVVLSTTLSPAPIADVQRQFQSEQASPDAKLTPRQRQWFDHAIDHILRGEKE